MGELKGLDISVLKLIEDQYLLTGFAASVSEIAEHMNMSKGSVLADSLKRLETAGKIVYHSTRKYYVPSNWRELAGGGEHSEELEKTKKLLAAAKKAAETWKEKAEAGGNAELERIREANRDRLRRFREKQKNK